MSTTPELFLEQVTQRLPQLTASAQDGPIALAADLLADVVANGGVRPSRWRSPDVPVA